MPRAVDVAEEILRDYARGPLNAVAFEKILYYTKAWSFVWLPDSANPLFDDAIEAWINGPVVPVVYWRHRGAGFLRPGDIERASRALAPEEAEVIRVIVDYYGRRSTDSLIALTHTEDPWLLARARDGAGPDDRSRSEITDEDMRRYYRSRWQVGGRGVPPAPSFLRAV